MFLEPVDHEFFAGLVEAAAVLSIEVHDLFSLADDFLFQALAFDFYLVVAVD